MSARKPTAEPVPPSVVVLRFEPGTVLTAQLVEPPAPLRVELLEAPKPPSPLRRWSRLLMGGLLILGLVYFILALWFVAPRTYVPPTSLSGLPDLTIALAYPTYLAFGDASTIDVTIVNRGTAAITGTVVLAFAGAVPVQTAPSKSTAFALNGLQGGASQTEQINVWLSRSAWLRIEAMSFRVLIEANSQQGALPGSQVIYTGPIPYLGTPLAWLPTGSVLLAGLLAFLWEQIKPRLAGRRER
jgi:hypothetical protein